jgi:hypothetical protein
MHGAAGERTFPRSQHAPRPPLLHLQPPIPTPAHLVSGCLPSLAVHPLFFIDIFLRFLFMIMILVILWSLGFLVGCSYIV